MISGFLFQSFFASACCMGRYFGWGSGGLAVNMIIVFAGRRDKVFGCFAYHRRSVFPTRKSRENYTKNAKRDKSRKLGEMHEKLFASKASDTFRMVVSSDVERMYPFVLFAEFSRLLSFRVFRVVFVLISRRENAPTKHRLNPTKNQSKKKRKKSGDNNLHRRAVFRVQCLTEPLAGNQLNNL